MSAATKLSCSRTSCIVVVVVSMCEACIFTSCTAACLVSFQVKVMKYQDELEAGRRSRKPEFSIAEQVEQYRRKQLRKVLITFVIPACHFSERHGFRETKSRSLPTRRFMYFQIVDKSGK